MFYFLYTIEKEKISQLRTTVFQELFVIFRNEFLPMIKREKIIKSETITHKTIVNEFHEGMLLLFIFKNLTKYQSY